MTAGDRNRDHYAMGTTKWEKKPQTDFRSLANFNCNGFNVNQRHVGANICTGSSLTLPNPVRRDRELGSQRIVGDVFEAKIPPEERKEKSSAKELEWGGKCLGGESQSLERSCTIE
ncbi:hypothetical protein HPP92_021519 [Vanilla planifolia]|uniref:Uncharacterized protein n=1 Tax=Vanilla planifolia TaxID=51239 RepID=A0A835UH91_VANPL|nr:hypothetical protein HPP92_021884 [Vanilla planifolia]KAG0463043.1 hypothetical protein HPP92_021519 [Vanilla planifolia]